MEDSPVPSIFVNSCKASSTMCKRDWWQPLCMVAVCRLSTPCSNMCWRFQNPHVPGTECRITAQIKDRQSVNTPGLTATWSSSMGFVWVQFSLTVGFIYTVIQFDSHCYCYCLAHVFAVRNLLLIITGTVCQKSSETCG